ncbi:hypothetical protein SAMN02745165_03098 [Malonomonas rubra DSM 5091]|uniref:Uncharacterized protein n=1 Tax=Malonomonas rubra DSM 5091 TaxID=1122189 RepID=A0A1M6LXS6_MALRU|nr:hypothetical protein SAMN02745165_03098 [Malonomonas rubra DSM 5091]
MTSTTLINVAEKAKKAGIGQEQLMELLRLIGAPPELNGLMELLLGLEKVFPVSLDISKLNSDQGAISPTLIQTEETAKRLFALKNEFKAEGYVSLFRNHTKSRHDIFSRLLSKNPLYSCLGLLPLGDENNPGFRHLQAQLLLFSARHLGQDMGSHLNLFKAVRDLTNLKLQEELLQLPQESFPSKLYFQQLALSTAPRLQVIGELSQEAPQPVSSATSTARKTTRTTPRKGTGAQRKTRIFPKTLPKSRRTLLTDDESDRYRSLGGHPDEIQPPAEEIPIDIPEEILSGTTFRELCFWAKIESNRRAMENQLLPYAWQEASLYDISVLIAFIQGRIDLPKEMPVSTEIKSALYLSLFLSRPVKEIAELSYLSADDNNTTNLAQGIFSTEQGELVVRLYAPGPELSEDNWHKEWSAAYPVTSHSLLPLPDICAEITAFLRPKEKEQTASPFATASSTLVAQTARVINVLRRVQNCRLSPARICRYIMNRLSRTEGVDLPKAALYLGLTNIDLATTRVHYSVAHRPSMEQSYRSLCADLFEQLQIDFVPAGRTQPINPDRYLGSPFCPRPDDVKSLVAAMLSRLDKLKSDLHSHQKLLNYHNHYTLYTALQTSYSSGYRAVNDRFFNPDEMDQETGMAVISDKDGPDFYSARQVWIHPLCREQLQHYQQHLRALFDHVGLSSDELFALFRDKSWPDIVCDFLIFPETSTNKMVNLTPSGLQALLDEKYGYKMPPNSNRHFIKNQLIESRCPPEIVEGFLGHWHNGQEPWNSLSSLHPADFQLELQTHLSKILTTCGWQSITGLSP